MSLICWIEPKPFLDFLQYLFQSPVRFDTFDSLSLSIPAAMWVCTDLCLIWVHCGDILVWKGFEAFYVAQILCVILTRGQLNPS
jgi:hypothetical protein